MRGDFQRHLVIQPSLVEPGTTIIKNAEVNGVMSHVCVFHANEGKRKESAGKRARGVRYTRGGSSSSRALLALYTLLALSLRSPCALLALSLRFPCAFLHLRFDLASCMTNFYRYHLFLARDPS